MSGSKRPFLTQWMGSEVGGKGSSLSLSHVPSIWLWPGEEEQWWHGSTPGRSACPASSRSLTRARQSVNTGSAEFRQVHRWWFGEELSFAERIPFLNSFCLSLFLFFFPWEKTEKRSGCPHRLLQLTFLLGTIIVQWIGVNDLLWLLEGHLCAPIQAPKTNDAPESPNSYEILIAFLSSL